MNEEHLKWIRSYLEDVYKTPIMENFLGLNIVELNEGKAVMSTKIAGEQCNFYGFIHGGILASISDVVMGVSCTTLGKRIVTIDMNISYIKNAPAGSILNAYGEVVSNGNTIMRATGEIYCGEQLLVRSQASYFVTGEFCEKDFPQPLKINA
ncbi:MAG: PaaI family thioesterase [Bacillota bacterium]|nr:PaaI family thioesterase [Bacillota bacterium]